jgi:hypothetical protein
VAAFRLNFTTPATADEDGGSALLDRCLSSIELAFLRLEKLVGASNGLAPLGPDGLVPAKFLGDSVNAATLMATATGAVNAAVTATLPAVAGKVHLITSIELVKLYGVVGVAAGAGVIVTSTNLPGNPAWTTEQLASAAGTAIPVISRSFAGNPLRSLAAGIATTLVAPAQLQTVWRWNVTYLLGTP